jgi:DNA topoisomerase-1
VSYEFTAAWRTCSTTSPAGRKDRVTELGEFYYGSDDVKGLHALVTELGDIDARELATFPIGDPELGINLRSGATAPTSRARRRRQPAGKRANVPDDLPPDELTMEKAKELLANPAGEEIAARLATPRPGCGWSARTAATARTSPSCCPDAAPRRPCHAPGSLFKSMSLRTRSPSTTRSSCSRLPRVVGPEARGREEITAPERSLRAYLKKGTDSRSSPDEDSSSASRLDEALEDLRPAQAARPRRAAPPLKELGNDPVSGQPVVVKAGRFGEYVTDGEYNATLRKDDTVEAITLERAAELLAERRERGPARRPPRRARRRRPRRRPPPRRRPRGCCEEDRQEGASKSA